MPASRRPLPQRMEQKKPDDDLFQTLALLKTEHEFRRFLYAVATKGERSMISRRWRVTMLLYEGYDVVEIHELTGIAKGTISDVKKLIVGEPKADEVCRVFHKRLRDFHLDASGQS